MEKAIYELIQEAVNEEGILSEDFTLPEPDSSDDANNINNAKIRFAPGAMDGISIFHMQHSSNTESEEYKQIVNSIQLASKGAYEKANQLIDTFAVKGHMISYIDDMQNYIIEQKGELDAKNIYHFALHLILHGTKPEAVKAGMSMMELFNTNQNEKLKQIFRTLALSDEFTLYAGYLMRDWDNSNQEIFEAVKKVRGWGRVFLINFFLEADNEEIQHWLLLNGVHNEVLPNYSAMVCYRNAQVYERLEKPMLLEEYRGVADIFDALLDDEPEPGISCFENSAEVLDKFLQQTLQCEGLEAEDYNTIYRLMTYAEHTFGSASATFQQAKALLYSSEVQQTIKEALKHGSVWELARNLGIDYKEQAYQALLADFEKNYYAAAFLIQDNYRLDDVLALTYERLEVDKIGTGSKAAVSFGPEYANHQKLSYLMQFLNNYPGKGTAIIKQALLSPLVNNRTTAIKVIEQWTKKLEKPLKECFFELYQYICDILPNEVREDVQKMMKDLIYEVQTDNK